MNQKILKICLICFIIIVIIICPFIIPRQEKTINRKEEQKTINPQPINSLFSNKIGPTVSQKWLTFNEQKLKYSLSYPVNWTLDNWNIQDAANIKGTVDGFIWGHARFSSDNHQFEIIAWGNKARTSILQWLKWYRRIDLEIDKLPKETNYIFQEEKAVRIFQEKTSFNYPVVRIFFQKGDFLYEILYRMDQLKGISDPSDQDMQKEPYRKMLQSLKFIL